MAQDDDIPGPGEPSTDGRRSQRGQVNARARFRQVGANPYEVELRDISATGFRMVTYTRPAIGTRIWVTLPGLQSMEAIVRRATGNEYGCEFVQPLHPSVAEYLQKQLG